MLRQPDRRAPPPGDRLVLTGGRAGRLGCAPPASLCSCAVWATAATYIPVYGHKERVTLDLLHAVTAGTCHRTRRGSVSSEDPAGSWCGRSAPAAPPAPRPDPRLRGPFSKLHCGSEVDLVRLPVNLGSNRRCGFYVKRDQTGGSFPSAPPVVCGFRRKEANCAGGSAATRGRQELRPAGTRLRCLGSHAALGPHSSPNVLGSDAGESIPPPSVTSGACGAGTGLGAGAPPTPPRCARGGRGTLTQPVARVALEEGAQQALRLRAEELGHAQLGPARRRGRSQRQGLAEGQGWSDRLPALCDLLAQQ